MKHGSGFALSAVVDRRAKGATASEDGPKNFKQLNGLFRTWMRFQPADPHAPAIIWGRCIVHLSHPEFSGNVLHTSGMLAMTDFAAFKIVETRNNLYALLGPELVAPADRAVDPRTYIGQCDEPAAPFDAFASAAINADRECRKCNGSGVYHLQQKRLAICDRCCKHNQGWWLLEGSYGPDNGRWACKAGCGHIVDTLPLELEFLPRALE